MTDHTTGKSAVYSLAISARATIDLHSLNNEGGEGNQIQTRMVNIIGQDGRLHNVNAISGDMWKHIQAEHLHRIITGRGGIPLCAGCKEFNANRINADPDYIKATEKLSDVDALDEMLKRCGMDDMEGNLVTAGKRSLARKSVSEFGWVVGVPQSVTTDSFFHVKYVNERSQEQRTSDREATVASGSNLGQSIFHRPTSSGLYALVNVLEPARIGFNDINQQYPITEEQRQLRYEALLESLLYTYINPRGAMRSTQNPHLVGMEGVMAWSASATPAPTVSPLKDTYREEVENITKALETLRPGAVQTAAFDNLAQFTELMTWLIKNTTPLTLQFA